MTSEEERTEVGVMESIARSSALEERRPVVADPVTESEAVTDEMTAETEPERSTSATEREPVDASVELVSVRVLAAELAEPTEMLGASFAPVMVMVTSWVRWLISLEPAADAMELSSVTAMR